MKAKELKPGEGGIVEVDNGRTIAAYRDEKGVVHGFSKVCTHSGCDIEWAQGTKTFDCPCHGGRFTCKGQVINGPPSLPLATIELVEKDGEVIRK